MTAKRQFVATGTKPLPFVCNVVLGSSGSNVALVNLILPSGYENRILSLSDLTSGHSVPGQTTSRLWTSIDRSGPFTVVASVQYVQEITLRTWFTLFRDDIEEFVSHTPIPGSFSDFKGRMAAGVMPKHQMAFISLFDIAGRGRPEVISTLNLGSVLHWHPRILHLSDDTVIAYSLKKTHLVDVRIPRVIEGIPLHLAHCNYSACGVVAGCSVFFCIENGRADSQDKLLVFERIECPGVTPGTAWTIAINKCLDQQFSLVQIFAWHPAQGSMSVVIFHRKENRWRILQVNPRTHSYVTLCFISEFPRLAPGYICGQPEIFRIGGEHSISVLV